MKKGLSSNVLKIIAVIFMIIDHIGLYLYKNFSQDTYYILRSIGRIAMPIFAYLMVQSFFYTKNLKKYLLRVFIIATITQIVLLTLGYINEIYFQNYWIGVNNYLGVLYSYTLSLVLLTIIDKKIIFNKLNENQNLILRINIFIIIVVAYLKLKIEFDMLIPFIFLEFYAIEKFFYKEGILLKKNKNKTKIYTLRYIILIFISLIISLVCITCSPGCKYAMILSIVFIALYNGERGKNSEFAKYIFYIVFPLQHIILYLLAMIN